MLTTRELVETIIDRYDPEDYVDVLGIDIESLVELTIPYLEEFSSRFQEIIVENEDEEFEEIEGGATEA